MRILSDPKGVKGSWRSGQEAVVMCMGKEGILLGEGLDFPCHAHVAWIMIATEAPTPNSLLRKGSLYREIDIYVVMKRMWVAKHSTRAYVLVGNVPKYCENMLWLAR